jgi:hypothetical protein
MSMPHQNPPPDQALAEHPMDYSDPELREYTDEFTEDLMSEVVPLMPIILPLAAAMLMFMLAAIAVYMA